MIKIANVTNDAKGIEFINTLKKEVKSYNRYSRISTRVRTFGRCHNKKTAFNATGRFHSSRSNENGIYSFKSPQAPYCYAWAVYLELKQKPVKTQAYPDGMGA